MKDFELTLSLRNNQLKERRLKLGLSQRRLAKLAGVGYLAYSKLETLQSHGSASTLAKIARFFGCSPAELFPPAVLAAVNRTKRSVAMKLSARDVAVLQASVTPMALPDEEYQSRHLPVWIERALNGDGLKPREALVLRARFGLGGDESTERTHVDVGQTIGVSRERVRAIEAKALRKLRTIHRRVWKAEQAASK